MAAVSKTSPHPCDKAEAFVPSRITGSDRTAPLPTAAPEIGLAGFPNHRQQLPTWRPLGSLLRSLRRSAATPLLHHYRPAVLEPHSDQEGRPSVGVSVPVEHEALDGWCLQAR